MVITLPLEKNERLRARDLCMHCSVKIYNPMYTVASVFGSLVFVLPGVEFGRLHCHYRNLERDKIKALAQNNGDYKAFISFV